MVIWITGLSGSGKTTLCKSIFKSLKPRMPELVFLDGDVVRAAFSDGLGYKEIDRSVQIKRMQRLGKILYDQGLSVLVAALYSHPELSKWNRSNFTRYYEVYLETSLEALYLRDNKGLYKGAMAGTVKDVVGVDIPWNIPESPDLIINNDNPDPPEQLAEYVITSVPFLDDYRTVS